jgi:hypothetical protein
VCAELRLRPPPLLGFAAAVACLGASRPAPGNAPGAWAATGRFQQGSRWALLPRYRAASATRSPGSVTHRMAAGVDSAGEVSRLSAIIRYRPGAFYHAFRGVHFYYRPCYGRSEATGVPCPRLQGVDRQQVDTAWVWAAMLMEEILAFDTSSMPHYTCAQSRGWGRVPAVWTGCGDHSHRWGGAAYER